jgi:hypothetical protein
VLELDAAGLVQWANAYGNADDEEGLSIVQGTDGGWVVSGWRYSAATDDDVWLVKLSDTGGILWEKTYGGTTPDRGPNVRATGTGGYAVMAVTTSYGEGLGEYWVLKTDADGQIPSCALISDTMATLTDTTPTLVAAPTTVTASYTAIAAMPSLPPVNVEETAGLTHDQCPEP